MQNIESKLAAMQAEFPFPEQELQRTLQRGWITNWAKKGGIGAEIGVFRGHFSDILLEKLRPSKLYLVDHWTLEGSYFDWGDSYTSNNTLPTAFARGSRAPGFEASGYRRCSDRRRFPRVCACHRRTSGLVVPGCESPLRACSAPFVRGFETIEARRRDNGR